MGFRRGESCRRWSLRGKGVKIMQGLRIKKAGFYFELECDGFKHLATGV